MASLKRKGDKTPHNDRPEKKAKAFAAKTPLLQDEEAPFPRGGASVLTPLEHKQIQVQAKQDVLFEQTTGRKAPRNEFGDQENQELSEENPDATPLPRAKKSRGASKTKRAPKPTEEKPLRIESLSYKVGTSQESCE